MAKCPPKIVINCVFWPFWSRLGTPCQEKSNKIRVWKSFKRIWDTFVARQSDELLSTHLRVAWGEIVTSQPYLTFGLAFTSEETWNSCSVSNLIGVEHVYLSSGPSKSVQNCNNLHFTNSIFLYHMKRIHENISAIEIHINFLLKLFLYLLKCLEKRFKIWFICGQISVKTHKQRPECKVSFGWRATTGRILVFVKVGLECECFAAMATLERFRIGVGLSVRSKIRFIGEGLWTKPAFVGSFSYNKNQWFCPWKFSCFAYQYEFWHGLVRAKAERRFCRKCYICSFGYGSSYALHKQAWKRRFYHRHGISWPFCHSKTFKSKNGFWFQHRILWVPVSLFVPGQITGCAVCFSTFPTFIFLFWLDNLFSFYRFSDIIVVGLDSSDLLIFGCNIFRFRWIRCGADYNVGGILR